MKRIRIHNDIQITWAITINGQAVSLEDKKLSLQLVVFNHVIDIENFTTSGNIIRFKFDGTEQKRCGRYTLVLRDTTSGKLNTIDKVNAFELVPHSYEQGGEDNPKVALEVVNLSTDTDSTTIGRAATIRINDVKTLDYSQSAYVRNIGTINDASLVFGIPMGRDGKSAFDVAQANGFSGTAKEWLESLKANIGSTLKSIDNSSSVGSSLPTSGSCLYYNGKSWEWKSLYSDDDIAKYLAKNKYVTQDWVKNQNYGSGSSGGGSVSQDQINTAVSNALSNYYWWGRSFASGVSAIVGGIHVTDIFFSQDGATNEKKLKLDSNGDLYFDGNFYATGGITALGKTSGGGSSGDGTLSNSLTIYNSNGVGWNFNGSSPLGLKFGDGLSATVSNDIITVSATGSSGTSSGIQCYLNGNSVGTFSKMYFSGNVEVSKNSYDSDMVNVKVTGGSSSSGSASNPYMLFFYGNETAGGTAGLVDGYDGSSSKYLKFIGSGVKTYQGTTNNSNDTTIVEITGGGSSVDLSAYLTKSDASSMYLGKSATADAAFKLATARSIWGQTFDGTGNVSGNMSGVGNIDMDGNISVTQSTFSLSSNGKSLFGFNSNKDLYLGYGYYQDSDAHLTLYGCKTLVNTWDGTKNRYFWFRDNYLSIPDDGELRIGNGKLIWDDTNKAFRMTSTNGGNCNFYCDGGITALGVQSTSASSVDFDFKNLTVNNNLYFGDSAKYLTASGDDLELHLENIGCLYFDNGSCDYSLVSDGSVYVHNLNSDGEVNIAGVTNLAISGNSNSIVITFKYNGKTYTFEPSDSQVSIK